jgi:hypothetical protein
LLALVIVIYGQFFTQVAPGSGLSPPLTLMEAPLATS